MSRGGADADVGSALLVLRGVVGRLAAATRLESGTGTIVLRSVVQAAVALIRAEAASIALLDPATGRLVFRVAAGEQGDAVVGLAIGSDEGVAGYVFSSGQPLALGEADADPRFGRGAAEQTGYVPRSLIAVPLGDDSGTIGVLEVLDRRDGEPFDLRDLEAATVFARQATAAIRATQLDRDAASLLASALASLAALDEGQPLSATDTAALVSAATSELSASDPTWALADAISRIRDADPGQLELVLDILDSLARSTERRATTRRRVGRR